MIFNSCGGGGGGEGGGWEMLCIHGEHLGREKMFTF